MASEIEIAKLRELFSELSLPFNPGDFGEVLNVQLYVLVNKSSSSKSNPLSLCSKIVGTKRFVVCYSTKEQAQEQSVDEAMVLGLNLDELLRVLPHSYGVLLDYDLADTQNFAFHDKQAKTKVTLSSFTGSAEEFEGYLIEEVVKLCSEFSQIVEAYFLYRPDDPLCPLVVGLLCSGLHSEQRYLLIEEFAKLSQSCFDSPSAIDVFDDLDVRNSRSWDLFKTLLPIYSRENQAKRPATA